MQLRDRFSEFLSYLPSVDDHLKEHIQKLRKYGKHLEAIVKIK